MLKVVGDGNGGYSVSKGAMVFWATILLFIGALIPAVIAYGRLNEKVDNLETNLEVVDKLENRIDTIEFSSIKTSTHVEIIKEDIKEIKSDIKILLGAS